MLSDTTYLTAATKPHDTAPGGRPYGSGGGRPLTALGQDARAGALPLDPGDSTVAYSSCNSRRRPMM